MSEHLVSPVGTVTLAGRSYTLDGSFATLRAVAHAFREDLLDIQGRIAYGMRVDEVARLLSVAVTSSGGALTEEDAGALLLDEVDITGPEYVRLKGELMAWMNVALAPRRAREEATRKMGELLARLSSPGANTSGSPSVPSAGPRRRSGKATPGN